MKAKQVRGTYMLEFELEAVRQVKTARSIAEVARVLSMRKTSLAN